MNFNNTQDGVKVRIHTVPISHYTQCDFCTVGVKKFLHQTIYTSPSPKFLFQCTFDEMVAHFMKRPIQRFGHDIFNARRQNKYKASLLFGTSDRKVQLRLQGIPQLLRFHLPLRFASRPESYFFFRKGPRLLFS